MNEEKLRELIKSDSRSEPKRTWRCPSENELAAYVEGQFAGIKRQRLEGHFANCDWCIEVLAFLGQGVEPPSPESVPGHLLTRARLLARAERVKGRRRQWSWATAAAAACILVVAVFIVWRLRTEPASVPPADLVAQHQASTTPSLQPTVAPEPSQRPVEASDKPKRTDTNKTRGTSEPITPAIISPRDGGMISKSKAFKWSTVDNAQFYEVKVVTSDGTPVFKESVIDTQLPLRLQTALQPGSEYFVAIEANLSDGRVIRSKLVKFRVAP